jgi:hypothetical protein
MVIRSSCPVFVANAKSLRAGHTSRDVYTRGVGAVVSLPGLLVAPDAIPAYLPAEAGIARIWLPRILPVQTTRFSEVVSGCPSKAIPEPDEYPSTQRARPALPGSAVTDPRGQRWGSERSERGRSPVSPQGEPLSCLPGQCVRKIFLFY